MKRLLNHTYLFFIIALILMLAAPANVLADGGGDEITKIVQGYQVSLVIEKPLAVGTNSIHFQIKDSHGIPVSNADVYVSLLEGEAEHTESEPAADTQDEMSAEHTESEPAADTQDEMSGMSGESEQPQAEQSDSHEEIEKVKFEAGHGNGEYAGEIAIHEAGEWTIRAHLAVRGELFEIDFPLSVASIQSGPSILAGFFVANLAIIAAALVMKHKPFSLKSVPEVRL